MIRWLLVIPAALVGWALGVVAQVICFYASKLGHAVNPLFLIFNACGWVPFDWLSSYLFVRFGAKTAPGHRTGVAIVLLVLMIASHAMLIICKALFAEFFEGPNYSYAHMTVAAIGGIAAATYAFYQTKVTTQSNNEAQPASSEPDEK